MTKKVIFSLIAFLIIAAAYIYFTQIYGWMEFRKNTDTPKVFLSHINASSQKYSQDSFDIQKQFHSLLSVDDQFFGSKEYFESTQITIDTIIYGPGLVKLAVFAIAKNPTYKQLMPDKNHDWYYDATCFLGVRQGDTIALTRIGPNFSNSSDEKDISNYIREVCLRRFVEKDDTSGAYAYNMNDVRFWDCAIWKNIEEQRESRRRFEELKKNHPEDVYEPKN